MFALTQIAGCVSQIWEYRLNSRPTRHGHVCERGLRLTRDKANFLFALVELFGYIRLHHSIRSRKDNYATSRNYVARNRASRVKIFACHKWALDHLRQDTGD